MYADLSDADRGRLIDAGIGARMDCDDDNLPEGIDHAGVFVTTGLGDGRYPVYADVMELPGGGTRVACIIVDCLGTEPETPSDNLRESMVDAVEGLREQTQGGIDVRLPYDESQAIDDEVRRRALGEEPEA
jgi:hypothetical protein